MKVVGVLTFFWILAGLPAGGQEPKAVDSPPLPEVWIFNGTPGDDEHHLLFEDNLARLRKSLTKRFRIAKGDLQIYYGPKDAGYAGICDKDTMLDALGAIVENSKKNDAPPVWIIFQGHANRIPGDAMFNLPGPDLSARDIGDALKGFNEKTPLVVIATTACSDAFLKPLASRGRVVMTANSRGDKDNETEFPSAFVEALESPDADTNRDGLLTATEIFRTCFRRVIGIYEDGGFMVTEHPQLDGDGDGKATQRPAQNDAAGGDKVALPVKPLETFE